MLQLFLGFVKRLDRCSFASPRRKNTALALGKPVPMPCAGELHKGVAGRHRVRPYHFVIAVWRAKQNRTHGYIMKLKRVIGVVGLVAVYCGPRLFFILAVALGVNIGVALFITLGMVIVIRFVLNIDF